MQTFRRADELLDLLEQGADRADPIWLQAIAAELTGQLLEIERLRRALGPRRLQAMATARRVQALHAQGIPASTIGERLGLSRPRVYQLLDSDPVVSGNGPGEPESD